MTHEPGAFPHLEPGQTWKSKYIVRRLLGRGNMGLVFRAYASALKTEVTLKILFVRPVDSARYEQLKTRFLETMKACADLEHPNIARVLEYGEYDGRLYLVRELVDGPTLRDVLSERRSPLPFDQTLSIFQQVADALHYAHHRGVIHQDIRPGNVLLADSGERPVVVDFGLLGVMSGDSRTTAEYSPRAPLYMSPEQASGGSVGPRSDVYSLGVLLYEMVTGDVPFKGMSPAAVLVQHLQQPPRPPSELNPGLDVAVEMAIMKALAKNPAERFESPLALLEAIQQQSDPDEFDTITLSRESLRDFRERAMASRQEQASRSQPVEAGIVQRRLEGVPLPWMIGVVVLLAMLCGIILLISMGPG
ncbi:MAG: hypothetical protein Kow0077_11660 [Anaerolineae bacterium]